MVSAKPVLSERARAKLDSAQKSPFAAAFARVLANQWSEENPNGIVNARLAENSLMHDSLARFWERQGSLRISHTDLTYGTSLLGSDRLLGSLSRYFQAYFKPSEPVLPGHIATSNGLSTMIEHVAAVVSDPDDAWLLPAPYYNGFVRDLNGTSQVRVASVDVPLERYGTVAEVELLHAEMERREREGVKQKIAAVLITNPHNPLGFCYSREVLLAYCRFAERWNLFLVSDEIYGNSVFEALDAPNALPFTSILGLDVAEEANCDPSRILALYGMSKDFGANGFRAGALVCQHNADVLEAIKSNAITLRMSSPTDILWSAILDSAELPEYLAQNRCAVARTYTYLTSWLQAHDIAYRPATAGHFVIVDFRKQVEALARQDALQKQKEDPPRSQFEGKSQRFEYEIALFHRLLDGGVYLGPGSLYAFAEPGFFRFTFCLRRNELEVVLDRIETVFGLRHRALELSSAHPE